MKTIKTCLLGAALSLLSPLASAAETGFSLETVDPEADRLALQAYYQKRFPGVPLEDYVNGIYAIDPDSRKQWDALMEFPPYEFDLEEGEVLFNTPFANGKGYADCFENGGIGIRQKYPYWNSEEGTVKTLEQEINECRVENGEQPLKWKRGDIAKISAYMASTSRGKPFEIDIPENDPRALQAYLDGKRFFYTKRGQLNLSCANCHLQGSRIYIRADLPGPTLGHPTHFPVVRSKWGDIGTLHRRYEGCYRDTRSVPIPAQDEQFRKLEYFQTYMSNGLPVNGPGARK
ncbi:sulfur oxidation c-type cytochrome SoxA [Marinobacterium weihaiense]|uniref:SoxAX cytochrome complex subunit A n=1 Tax=Marinobacterium weihaiense TaxID=2851016 RepID=A0ABS6MBC3_9GAMM|nr:sulfur oxidation c-type cytochrome SoxA [Marinobacterium weihaiense]MBV0933575.1 sulfur oxidation c-type cytochrome SoxA [Marinobacterium weihaiense]